MPSLDLKKRLVSGDFHLLRLISWCVIKRCIRVGLALRCKQLWLSLHSMETATLAQRERFLTTVQTRFAAVQ